MVLRLKRLNAFKFRRPVHVVRRRCWPLGRRSGRWRFYPVSSPRSYYYVPTQGHHYFPDDVNWVGLSLQTMLLFTTEKCSHVSGAEFHSPFHLVVCFIKTPHPDDDFLRAAGAFEEGCQFALWRYSISPICRPTLVSVFVTMLAQFPFR